LSYIHINLISGERIVFSTKLDWIIFVWTIIWFILAVRLLGAGGDSALTGVFFLLFAILSGITSLINYSNSELGITNKRVIVKMGFIRRNSLGVLLSKVEGIQVNQGILGRILGYGSIIVSGTAAQKIRSIRYQPRLNFGGRPWNRSQ